MAAPSNAIRVHGTRQDTYVVRLNVAGHDFGIWDKKTGGEFDSDELKYFPGGMRDPISLGGRRQTGNVTLQRLYDGVDDGTYLNVLLNAVGRGKCEITQRAMDLDGNPYGQAIHYSGIVKRVSVPDVDSESTTAALIEVEATISGAPHKGA